MKWEIAGLMDAHVHLALAAARRKYETLPAAADAEEHRETMARVLSSRGRAGGRSGRVELIFDWRPSLVPPVEVESLLDGCRPAGPVLLLSHDLHSGLLGRGPGHAPLPLQEEQVFAALRKTLEAQLDELVRPCTRLLHEMRARAVVRTRDYDGGLGRRLLERIDLENADGGALPVVERSVFVPEGAEGAHGGPHPMLRLKLFVDGAFSSFSAALSRPYENAPANLPCGPTGILRLDGRRILRSWEAWGRRSMALHCCGDRALDEALEALEEMERMQEGAARAHVLEHVQIARPDQLERLARLGVEISIQPLHLEQDWEFVERHLPSSLREHAYCYRRMQEAGLALRLGSDHPVAEWNPLETLRAAVTPRIPAGEGRDRSLAPGTAVRAMRAGAEGAAAPSFSLEYEESSGLFRIAPAARSRKKHGAGTKDPATTES